MASRKGENLVVSDRVLQFFLTHIEKVRPEIRQLMLFGSRAREDARSDSDYDLLIVVAAKNPALEDALYDAVIDTLLEHGRLVSLKIFTASEYERLKGLSTPFMKRVQAEGLSIE